MKYFTVHILFSIFLLTASCSERTNSDTGDFNSNEENVLGYSLGLLDTIYLDADSTSQIGYFFKSDLGIHYADRIQSKIFTYDWTGKPIGTYLGVGDGPSNQNGLHGIVYQDNRFYILSDVFMSRFNTDYILDNRSQLKWGGKESYEEMLSFPREDMFGLYEISWISRMVNLPFIALEGGKGYILPVMMTHPKLNGYWTSEYYKKVFNLGLFDENFQLTKLGGRRSELYLDHQYLPNFDYTYFVKKGDSLIVSFPIDPSLYIYDLGLQYLGKFGEEGIGMKKDYIPTQTLEEAESQWEMDFRQFGYYDQLYYDEKSQLLFRSYVPKGTNGGFSRLQIYQGESLIADLEVPLRFKVIGSKDGLFYADGIIDEENEKLAFYTFTIDEN